MRGRHLMHIGLIALALALPVDFDDWVPIDDPGLVRLPETLRLLPHTSRAAFENEKTRSFLLARRVEQTDGFAAAFSADEAVLSKKGEFIPIDEDYLTIRGVEALFLECEWRAGSASMKVAGLYASESESELTVLWIASPADVSTRLLLSELKTCYRRLRESFEPTASDVYRSLLNGHEISFELRAGRGRDIVALEPAPETLAADRAFFDSIASNKGRFTANVARNWRDEERGVTLSMQTFETVTGLGPKDPIVVWIASSLQRFVRTNKDEGDAPVELIHLENARTVVVSDEEVARHYENNQRAPEAGVILHTFLPRSPYANACRLRFEGKNDPRPALALMIELRAYPRSRTETVARPCVVLLLARARDAEDLGRLEESLEFRSAPLTEEPPLPDLPR